MCQRQGAALMRLHMPFARFRLWPSTARKRAGGKQRKQGQRKRPEKTNTPARVIPWPKMWVPRRRPEPMACNPCTLPAWCSGSRCPAVVSTRLAGNRLWSRPVAAPAFLLPFPRVSSSSMQGSSSGCGVRCFRLLSFCTGCRSYRQ